MDLFFELRNEMKALEDCELLSRDPSAGAWEKEQLRALRKRCSARSVGERRIRWAPSKGLGLLASPSGVTAWKWKGDVGSREAEDGAGKSAVVRGNALPQKQYAEQCGGHTKRYKVKADPPLCLFWKIDNRS